MVEYTAKPGTPDEQKCRAERVITVANVLRILDENSQEVGPTTVVEVDEEVFWHGNLSSGVGDYRWTAEADVQISGTTDQAISHLFPKPGTRM